MRAQYWWALAATGLLAAVALLTGCRESLTARINRECREAAETFYEAKG